MSDVRERWIIAVGGDYGAWVVEGTEEQAEERRRAKAQWEGAIGYKVREREAQEHPEALPQWCREWISDVIGKTARPLVVALLLVTLTACDAGIASVPAAASHPAGEAALTAVATVDGWRTALTTSAADKARDRHIDDLLARCAMDPQWRVDAVVLERCQAFAGARDDEAMRDLEAATAGEGRR